MVDLLAPAAMVVLVLASSAGAWFAAHSDRWWREGGRLLAEKHPAEAEACFRKTLALAERRHGKDHWRVALHLHAISTALMAQRRLDDADEILARALALIDRDPRAPKPSVAYVWLGAAQLRRAQGRLVEALELVERARPLLHQPRARAEAAGLALDLHDEAGDLEGAVTLIGKMEVIDHSLVTRIARAGAGALKAGNAKGALDCFEPVLDFVSYHSPGSTAEGFYRLKRAEALAKLGRHAEARADVERIVADADRHSTGRAIVVEPLLLLAATALALGDREAARGACTRVLEMARRPVAAESPYRAPAAERSALDAGAERATRMLEALARE